MALMDGWGYYKALTIDQTKIDAELASGTFVCRVYLNADADVGAHALASGYDLRFTNAAGDALYPFEREDFVVAGGAATGNFWVRIDDAIAADADTIFCMYYGNAGAGDASEACWPATVQARYDMVRSGATIPDSTANANDGTLTGTVQADGKINKGESFDGVGDVVTVADADTLDFGTGVFSVTASVSPAQNIDAETDQVGDLVTKFNQTTKVGFNLGLLRNTGNNRNLFWGIDNNKPDAVWTQVAAQLNSQVAIYSLAVFNGKLYGGTYGGGRLFEWNGTNAWVQVAPQFHVQTSIISLAVFNGKLYGGTGPDGRLFEWNGTDAWTEVAPQLNSRGYIYSLAVFNGKLYGGAAGVLFEWNGTNAWVQVAPQLNSQTYIPSLAVFNDKLYGGTNEGGRLFEWNGTNAWVQVAPQLNSQTLIPSLAVFNGKLYGGTYGGGRLFEWNGTNAWVQVAPQLNSQTYIPSLAVFNGKLYGGTDGGRLFEWNGADAWTQVAPQLNSQTYILPLAVFNGKLYGGAYTSGVLFEWKTGIGASYDYPLPSGWSHIHAVRDTTTLKLYLNGALVKTSAAFTQADYNLTNASALLLGSGQQDSLKGILDEVRIESGAPSDAWVKADYNSSFATLVSFGAETATDFITVPGAPTGNVNPSVGHEEEYTTTGATGSGTIEYQFTWDDSDTSEWSTELMASHTYTATGNYDITVTARLQGNTSVTETSAALAVVVAGAITQPGIPTGEQDPLIGYSNTYSTTGSTGSGTIEYQWTWDDGETSSWSENLSASHAYAAAGNYHLYVTARLQANPTVTNTSDTLPVTALAETISTPGTPTGTASVESDTSQSYVTTGSISGSGHTIEYQWNYGDGNISSWVSGTPGKTGTHRFRTTGTYNVIVTARCAVHTTFSAASSALSVSVVGGVRDIIWSCDKIIAVLKVSLPAQLLALDTEYTDSTVLEQVDNTNYHVSEQRLLDGYPTVCCVPDWVDLLPDTLESGQGLEYHYINIAIALTRNEGEDDLKRRTLRTLRAIEDVLIADSTLGQQVVDCLPMGKGYNGLLVEEEALIQEAQLSVRVTVQTDDP